MSQKQKRSKGDFPLVGGNLQNDCVRCRACLEPIPVGARKCSHCGNAQNWLAYFPITQSVLALLIALVSVVMASIPIIKTALETDDSQITFNYIDRPDTTIPVIASNKGKRPGVIFTKAGFKIATVTQTHFLTATVLAGSRESLLIPENTSKQFFFAVDPVQVPEDPFPKVASDIKDFRSIKRCTLAVEYQDFSGKETSVELTIFDAARPRTIRGATDVDLMLGPLECIGKIPEDVRLKYQME
jgi:hypothetical protein